MRIWYQSFASFERLVGYASALREFLQSLATPEVAFEVYGLERGGLGDQFRVFEHFDTAEILRNARRAEREGFDAVAIGNILDPGLREAREVVDIPVLGLCEASLLLACLMGRNFSLVTVNERFIPRIEENVRRYGLRERLCGIDTMGVEVEELDRAYRDPAWHEGVVERFTGGVRRLLTGGAEVVIPAGGVAMLFLARAGVHVLEGVPILNGIVALVRLAEMAVRFRKTTGIFASRRLMYRGPSPELLAEARRVYNFE